MRRSWRRAVAAAVLLAGSAQLASVTATAEPAAEGPPTEVTALTLSAPVEPSSGFSGQRPSAPPDVAPAETEGEPVDPDSEALGTQSVIGPDDRERVNPTTTYPNSAVGQLDVTWRTDEDAAISGYCSGFLIDENSVLAAGHCVYDINPAHGPLPHLIESGTFTPGRNRGTDPYGTCEIESAWAPPQYTVDQQVTYDFSVINLSDDCDLIGSETGTFGLFARTGQMAQVKGNVQGYPADWQTTQFFGDQKRAHGKIARSQKRLVFYPMDTTGGQSGGPVWRQRSAGVCVGPCAMAVHAYGTDPQSTGVWRVNNAGIRLTAFRIGQILDIAAQNDGGP